MALSNTFVQHAVIPKLMISFCLELKVKLIIEFETISEIRSDDVYMSRRLRKLLSL